MKGAAAAIAAMYGEFTAPLVPEATWEEAE
jgi:hypothetical protein